MHDELYGHLLAALRLGAGKDGCRSAVCIAFEPAQPDGALHLRVASLPMYSAHTNRRWQQLRVASRWHPTSA